MAQGAAHRGGIPAKTSADFRRLHAAPGSAIRARWSEATEAQDDGVAGAFRSTARLASPWKGAQSRTPITIGATPRTAGLTVHVWHADSPDRLARNGT